MTETEIRAKLTEIFRDVFDDKTLEINPQTTAADVEHWDSLSHVSMIVAVEKAFGVRFTTGQVQALKNVGDLLALIGSTAR